MIVDEAQDLSDVQVDYIQSIEDSLDILVTIRDNDQSIYSYRSENVGSHIIQNPDDVIRQDETHRCSQKVAEYAASLGNFDLQSARPSIGSVELDERALGNIVRDLSGNLMKNNKTDIFVLTRTRRQKKKVERLLLKSNIHYSGISDIIYSSKNTPAVVETLQSFARGDYPSEITDFADSSDPLTSDLIETYCENKRLSDREIEMVKRVLDEEEYLDDVDIKIGTYHSSKGLEANSAILCSDWISKRNPEHPEERRVAYVGATRAREDLRVTSIGQGQQNQILRNAAAEFGWNN
jgi:superfamily I DNA/RNA helicase